MSEKFVAKLQQMLHDSVDLAVEKGHAYITLETMLAVALMDDEVKDIIVSVGGNYDALATELEAYLDMNGNIPPPTVIPGADNQTVPPRETTTVAQALQMTVARAKAAGKKEVTPKDIFIVIMDSENSYASHYIAKNGVDSLAVKEYVSHGDGSYEEDGEDDMMMTPMGPMPNPNRQKGPMTQSKATKILNEHLTNVNAEAEKGRIDPLIGREYEVDQLVKILARRKKNNPVLRGEAGVGKTAIPEGLARRINDANKSNAAGTLAETDPTFPELLLEATIWGLEIGNLVAGTKFRGEFEEKLKDIIQAVIFLNNECGQKNIIFIDEIHTALGAGATSGGSLDAGNILKPALSKGILRCIGSTTFDEYQKHFEKDRALARRFRPIDVYEPNDEDCFRILVGLREYYEAHHGVTYTEDALQAAIRLTKRYMHSAFLPDKAIDAIDAAGAAQQILPKDVRLTVIGEKEIQAEVARMARITVDDTSKDDSDKLANLAGQLGLVVYGQQPAIKTLDDAMCLSAAGLRPHNKTKGSYLFGGPTGVGKTEIAKQLADILGIELIRFNMSEYMEKHTVSRLIGAPPGYVGFDSQSGSGSGLLTDAVDKKPHAILLLDEVDKAHPDVFNIMLQVMDDGKLTNSNGKVVDFRNVLMIMTTNAGATESTKRRPGIGRDLEEFDDSKQMEAIEKFFTPEFRNRLDGVIIFDRLAPETMIRIVDKFVLELNMLSREKKVIFDLDDAARAWFAKEGYSPLYGARPLGRTIQENISLPSARQILFGDLKGGGVAKVSTVKETKTIKTNDGNIDKTVEKIAISYVPAPVTLEEVVAETA